jgi:hypothetical protein
MRFFKPLAEDEAAASRLAALASRTKAEALSRSTLPRLWNASPAIGPMQNG